MAQNPWYQWRINLALNVSIIASLRKLFQHTDQHLYFDGRVEKNYMKLI